MPFSIRHYLRVFAACVLLLCSGVRSYASHIFGVDLYYSHVGGNTYTVHLTVYGDCSSSVFYTLSTASPTIDIYNGNTYLSSITLAVQPPTNGVEVTPVCPSQAGNTQCSSITNPLPGIKKFVYTGNVTLTGTSSVFRFVFAGSMSSTSTAGRSSSITNINSPGTSTIQLVDTLNNVGSANSSSVYTTIPTPFFCINTASNYNPAAVDPESDSLVFALVPAVDAATSSSVSYISPYSATAPLAVTTGAFSFNSATGQLAFTPNAIQRSLVVYNVEEWRSGVLKGTSQREMTFVVLSPCSNEPPNGSVSSLSAGTATSGTQVSICNSAGVFSFQINPTDPNGDSITVTASGVPTGATFNVVNNGSTAPLGTFTWNTIGVAPGTYTFYLTYQDNGCPLTSQQTIAYTVTILPSPSEVVTVLSPATCTRKAVYTVTPGGVSGPWTINVLFGGSTLHAFTGVTGTQTDSLSPGTYTIRIYNSVNCYKDTSITIAQPPLPSAIITVTLPTCIGYSNGSISVAGTSGAAPYLYAIGAGSYSASGTFSTLSAGSYIIHISDANSCTKDTTITVANPTPTLAHIYKLSPLCNDLADGRVIIAGYNSIAPYTYAMGAGAFSATDTFSNLVAGTYTFHVRNANGCQIDTTLTLVDSLHLSGTVSIAPVACNGGNATITVTGVSGYGPPYSYAYNSGAFGPFNVFTLPAGSYTFHINDPQSCYFDTSLSITQPTPITITTSITNALCNGTATGSVVITATGGTPGYLYAADGGTYGASSTLTGLTAGTHTVYVQDANGCIFSSSITVGQPRPISMDSIVMQQPACFGSANGVITVYASGGVPAYTYAYNTGTYGAVNTFTGLTSAAYTLHIKDANGCIKDTTVTLLQPAAIVPTALVSPSFCNTLSDGHVTLSATGGTPGYTFAIGTGAYGSTGYFSPLAAGTYTLHVKDNHGCVKDTSITITDSLHVTGTLTTTPAVCYHDANGTITVAGSGGINPYIYEIGTSGYSSTNTFTGLAAGSYTIQVKDSVGCTGTATIAVTEPANLLPSVAITQPACNGNNNGSVVIAASGGTAAYTYSFDGGAFSSTTTYTSLPSGIDSFTIKDAHGCLHDTVFTILQPAVLGVGSLTVTNVSCHNGADGTVIVAGSGGTAPYQYAANASAYQTSSLLTGLAAGIQTIHIKDSHGCTIDTTVMLTQPAQLVFTGADTLNPTCQGYKNGSVTLLLSGGTTPYSYSIDNITFTSSSSFTSLAEGTYTFYVKDANGCSADTTITLTGYPHIIVDNITIKEPGCAGVSDGMATVTASGGVPPFTYGIAGGGIQLSPAVFGDLLSGYYTVSITDAKNCVKDTTFLVPQPDTLNIQTKIIPNECLGLDVNGAVITTVTGGTMPYSYLWSVDTLTTPNITGMPNGYYTVWVKDVNNCQDSATVNIGYDDCCTPYIPNAFSPNNDGKNDVFRLRYKGDVHIIDFSIYDRFGERVFHLENQDGAWDGKYKGVPCELGTYYYFIKFNCGILLDKVQFMKGDVTLVR